MNEILNKKEIAYGFISVLSATYIERVLGEMLGEIFEAVMDYEKYIEELSETEEVHNATKE